MLLSAFLAVHLVGLYLPGGPEVGIALFPHQDKVAHVLLFGAPAFLLRMLTPAWWPIILLVLHAPLSEAIQYAWIPFRSGDVLDLVADLTGIAMGVVAARWVGWPLLHGISGDSS